ncbi:transposable element Tcb1 transposase [Trichonephila clavipes]|nr:transposable element Tcb1 transposase [Trichonephila clavipes]
MFFVYHSTPFTAECSVRKTSIARFTLHAEPQTPPPPKYALLELETASATSPRCWNRTVVLPYLQGLPTAIFQQDNARPHVARIVQRFFVNHQIEMLPCPVRSLDLSTIENMWSMVVQRLPHITPPAPHQINFGNVWKLLDLLHPKNIFKVFLNQCLGVWQR